MYIYIYNETYIYINENIYIVEAFLDNVCSVMITLYIIRIYYGLENFCDYLRQNQFNLLVYGQDIIKNTVGRSAKYFLFFSILWVDILGKKLFFLSKQRRKTGNCFITVCLFSL